MKSFFIEKCISLTPGGRWPKCWLAARLKFCQAASQLSQFDWVTRAIVCPGDMVWSTTIGQGVVDHNSPSMTSLLLTCQNPDPDFTDFWIGKFVLISCYIIDIRKEVTKLLCINQNNKRTFLCSKSCSHLPVGEQHLSFIFNQRIGLTGKVNWNTLHVSILKRRYCNRIQKSVSQGVY